MKGSAIGRERGNVIAPGTSADCQKRVTFLVVSHSRFPSSSFSTQLLKKMADVKKVKTPQEFMSSSPSFLVVAFDLIFPL